MAQIIHTATLTLPDPTWLTAITDLDIAVNAQGNSVLYALSRSGEMLSAFQLQGNGTTSFIDQQSLLTETTAMDVISLGSASYAVTLGPTSPEPVAYQLDSSGRVTGVAALTASTAQEAATSLVMTQTAEGSYLYGSGLGSGQVQTYRVNAEGQLEYEGSTALSQGTQRLHAVSSAPDRMIAVSADGANLMTLATVSDGSLQQRGFAGAEQGLGLAEISLVRTLSLGGDTFVVVAARGSSSLSVLRMGGDGTLTPVSHIIDELSTRFQYVTAMDVVTDGERAYVVAGGADDGLSVFQLLGTGRLLHVASVADQFDTQLQNVSAIAAQISGDTLTIFAGSGVETGVSQFSLGLGQGGDVLTGTAYADNLVGTGGGDLLDAGFGNDDLRGGAGNDIFLDSEGSDRFWGEAGSDRFVMVMDGSADRIMDFDPTTDILDLSGYPMLRGVPQLEIVPLSYGALITYRGEQVFLHSHTGGSLNEVDLLPALAIGPGQLPVGSPGAQVSHVGTTASETVAGNDLDNTVFGLAGTDLLIGGAGDDRMFGGPGSDVLEGGAGSDLLYGDFQINDFDGPAAQIYRLYRATLDRAPDPAGHANWTEHLRSGSRPIEEIVNGFTNSAEFQATYGQTSNEAFVTLLYNNVLDRAPDPSGFANWVGHLTNGTMTRAEVVRGFSDSAEFVAATEMLAMEFSFHGALSSWTDEVWRLYQATLDRRPDVQGLENWTTQLTEGTSYLTVADGFIRSAEFQGIYGGTTDTQFVTLLYDNVLDRAPDAAGLANWLGNLASGMSRVDVVRGFAESAEFRQSTAAEMHDWIADYLGGDRLIADGNDRMFGGVGADTFVFDADLSGDLEVAALEAWDRIELANSGFANAQAAVAALHAEDGHTVLDIGGFTITFLDTATNEIGADQFLLI